MLMREFEWMDGLMDWMMRYYENMVGMLVCRYTPKKLRRDEMKKFAGGSQRAFYCKLANMAWHVWAYLGV